MTRQLKPTVVDEVTSPNGLVRLPVYFDRNEKDFYVEITGMDDRVRADSVNEVKKLAQEMLTKATTYKWEGIIAVELGDSYDKKYKTPGSYQYKNRQFGAMVELEFDRMERSKHPTQEGRSIYRKHTLDFEADEPSAYSRKQRDENRDLKQFYPPMDTVILPYDDETWAGLHAMKRAVDTAQAQLEALVSRKDVADRLRLIGKQTQTPILPAATGDTKTERKKTA
jgi:hypothetical protein